MWVSEIFPNIVRVTESTRRTQMAAQMTKAQLIEKIAAENEMGRKT
jgi:hypothetical protein